MLSIYFVWSMYAPVQNSAWKLAEIFFAKDRMVPEENRSDC